MFNDPFEQFAASTPHLINPLGYSKHDILPTLSGWMPFAAYGRCIGVRVNPQKFRGGLEPLISQLNALNIEFDLWVEPEMVKPDSDLYREHPGWICHSSAGFAA